MHTMPLETMWLGILKALAVPGLANMIILNIKQRGILLARIFIHNHPCSLVSHIFKPQYKYTLLYLTDPGIFFVNSANLNLTC
jgi:hypothetical protein